MFSSNESQSHERLIILCHYGGNRSTLTSGNAQMNLHITVLLLSPSISLKRQTTENAGKAVKFRGN